MNEVSRLEVILPYGSVDGRYGEILVNNKRNDTDQNEPFISSIRHTKNCEIDFKYMTSYY
jgi:hypothetical protein